MTKRMLVDATHPEETRVAIVDSYRDTNKLDDLDFDLASKPILRGNIYLAKVMRIEPSLQAAFVEYGGNRHGFLPFSEIHPDYFRIPIADRPEEDEAFEGDLLEASEEVSGNLEEDAFNEAPESGLPESGLPESELPRPPAMAEAMTSPAEPVEAQPADAAAPDAPAAEEAAASEVAAVQALEQDTETTPHPLPVYGEDGTDFGLITDFGNAALSAPEAEVAEGTLEAAEEQQPVESVGGEMTERVVRQHRPRYKIQEVIKRGQIMLIQVVKEERGNKGAALTTFLSLAGRYCVLMPNTGHGGGVSRKITNHQDRRRMKEILDQLEIPEGMAVILRTAGMEQTPPDIQRDLEYLLRLWDSIREQTLQSTAPALIYEEANLIKRSVRDLYSQDIAEILVAGEEGYKRAHDFMCAIMPDQVEKIKLYTDPVPLFFRYHVENQIDSLHSPIAQLRSGGYLVINPTEALVSIDVNSGRATRERHIEETALKTNLEAADEIARQLRLRDLAGLVVIDFIDMEDGRNNAAVERRMKEAMKNDRARLQIGRISPFGLMELSRQRLRPSFLEINFEKCPHCAGTGYIRSVDSAALSALRAIEEEGIKQRSNEIVLHVPARIALYILNQKREALGAIEKRYDLRVLVHNDDTLVQQDYKLERTRGKTSRHAGPAVDTEQVFAEAEREMPTYETASLPGQGELEVFDEATDTAIVERGERPARGRRFRQGGRTRGPRRGRQGPADQETPDQQQQEQPLTASAEIESVDPADQQPMDPTQAQNNDSEQRRRRRGRRGGRRRSGSERGGERGEGQSPRQGDWNAPEGLADVMPDIATAPEMPSAPFYPETASYTIPTSIHEIDTTPRAIEPRKAPSQNDAASAPSSSSYEVVNPPVDRPKGGWWRRLTGQE